MRVTYGHEKSWKFLYTVGNKKCTNSVSESIVIHTKYFISHLTNLPLCFVSFHSSTENAPPINQRRTLQLSKASSAGFGFTLQVFWKQQLVCVHKVVQKFLKGRVELKPRVSKTC